MDHTYQKLHMWTARWRYNVYFAFNITHITHRTLEILTSTSSSNQAESHHIGHTHFPSKVFSQYRAMRKTNFFKLVLGRAMDQHKTWYVASPDGPDQKLLKEFCYVKVFAFDDQTNFPS